MKTEIFCLAITALFFTACDVDPSQFEPEDGLLENDEDPGILIADEFSEDPSLAPPKGPFEFASPEPEPTSVSCTGWPSGDWCLARCSNGGWYAVGHWTSIPYGNCTGAGQSFCGYYGMGHTGACWGYP